MFKKKVSSLQRIESLTASLDSKLSVFTQAIKDIDNISQELEKVSQNEIVREKEELQELIIQLRQKEDNIQKSEEMVKSVRMRASNIVGKIKAIVE